MELFQGLVLVCQPDKFARDWYSFARDETAFHLQIDELETMLSEPLRKSAAQHRKYRTIPIFSFQDVSCLASGSLDATERFFGCKGLLISFRQSPLIDPYDVYQHLMEFWAAVFQDDVYLTADAGWLMAAKPRLVTDAKERADFALGRKSFKSDLLPAPLLIALHEILVLRSA